MQFPAPHRATVSTEHGWASRAYTIQDVADVFSYGGFFRTGLHDFQSTHVAKIALGGPTKLREALEKEDARD